MAKFSVSMNGVKVHPAIRKIGLARALSKLGYCSRSRAAELIRTGHVSLNGRVVRDPETAVRGEQYQIMVDGREVAAQRKIYLMMNKPRGIVTTASDEQGRETVYALLKFPSSQGNSQELLPWVGPIGRLDKASEGLLLLTNDSEWGARIAAPETHLEKTYHVQLGALVDESILCFLTSGVQTQDGEVLRARRARVLRSGQKNCWLEIVLDEGKNRQIRRMIETMDMEVLRLIRVAIGPLHLGDLAKGNYRFLSTEEKLTLDRAIRRDA